MLGYAFMGKAHSNAYKTQPYMMYPPVAIPELVAICGRNEEAVAGGAEALRLPQALHRLAEDAGRQGGPALRQRRAQRRPRRAVHRGRPGGQARLLREAAGAHRGRGQEDAGRGEEGRRQAPGRLQLPLRARRPPGLRADRERQAGADLPLPRGLPAGMDHAALRHAADLAPPEEARGVGRAGRPGRAHHRPGPLPRRRDRVRQRDDPDLHRAPRAPRRQGHGQGGRGRRVRGRRRVRERRDRHARGHALSRAAARTTTGSRSTARRARSVSTWSG